MELQRMDNRTGLRMGTHLERLKSRATYLLKDSLKIARVALVDVSTAELMTEDATNADEWGPTTKQMAEISNSASNSEDYLRIVHVLHERFALDTNKYWRQIHKSLILLEYLLCHGPEHLVMEFRQDKGRIEEFARFVYVDWKGTDRGSALQRRAKHVLHLLMDEAFYKNERTRAQQISRGISGFGSESLARIPARSKSLHSYVPRSRSGSSLVENRNRGDDSSTLLADEDEQFYSDPETPSTSERSISGIFSSSSGGDSLNASDRSINSTSSDGNPNEDSSPTTTLSFRKTSQILDMDSVASKLEVVAVVEHTSPAVMQKLAPPPPRAGYKCVMPRPPQSGSRVQRNQPQSVTPAHVTVPDLISI